MLKVSGIIATENRELFALPLVVCYANNVLLFIDYRIKPQVVNVGSGTVSFLC